MKTGIDAQRRGSAFEQSVIREVNSRDGWVGTSSPDLDHTQKTDVLVECPAGVEIPVQLSVRAKSKRTRNTLGKRGVLPIDGEKVNSAGGACAAICLSNFCEKYENCTHR